MPVPFTGCAKRTAHTLISRLAGLPALWSFSTDATHAGTAERNLERLRNRLTYQQRLVVATGAGRRGTDPPVRVPAAVPVVESHDVQAAGSRVVATCGVPAPGPETTDVGFFGLDNLPQLSRGRVIEQDLVAAFEFANDPTRLALFD